MDQTKIDNMLIKLSRELNLLDFVNPKNDHTEKQKFLKAYRKGEVYNPCYVYKRKKIDFEKFNKVLNEIETSDVLHVGIINNLRQSLAYITLLNHGITNEIYPFGKPVEEMVVKAKETIRTKKGPKVIRDIKATEARRMFLEAFKKYGFDWKVNIRKSASATASINPAKKTLYIKSKKYSKSEIKKLIVHEIEGHAMRAENGYLQPYTILGNKGTPSYLPIEEGLALFLEEMAGVFSDTRLRFICGRIIAVNMALSYSFYDIFKEMRETYNFSVNNAYIMAKRVKRGLEDTSKPGGFIKDHVYFEGLQRIKDYVSEGNDLRLLFAGKIGLEDLYLVEQGVLNSAKFFPRWLNRALKKKEDEKKRIAKLVNKIKDETDEIMAKQESNDKEVKAGIRRALREAIALKPKESFLLLYDKKKEELAEIFYTEARGISKKTKRIKIPVGKVNGQEPPKEAAKLMAKYDVVICLTTKSLSHTNARIQACSEGARIASLPGITKEIIQRTFDLDYEKVHEFGERIKGIMEGADEVVIKTSKGTNLKMSFIGREFKNFSGIIKEEGSFGNLPGSEVFSAPLEGKTNGVFVVDASMAGLGKVKDPLKIKVENGFVVSIKGERAKELKELLDSVKDKNAYNIAEFGIGTNPHAIITGEVLEDEKVLRTCHIALGKSLGFGGSVDVPIHLDGVIRDPTIIVDGKVIMEDGVFLV